MISAHNADEEFWDNMINLASTDKDVILKIGQIIPAKEIENRLFGCIVSPDDKDANPQCSEYKMD